MAQHTTKVLFLSYDGATDPLGQSQILPYLKGLARLGYQIDLVSFEKPERQTALAETRLTIEEAGITWYPQRYTKRPPVASTVFDLIGLRRLVRSLHERNQYDIVHCRSYLPMLAALPLKKQSRPAIVFDMRGFWPDEKRDAGVWPQHNPVYRGVYSFFRRREAEFLHASDSVVVLTHKAKDALASREGSRADVAVHVIPCSVDFDLFNPSGEERSAARSRLGVDGEELVLAYAGSLGTWYMLREMLAFFAQLSRRHPRAKFLIITPDSPSIVEAAATSEGIDPAALLVRAASRREMPRLLAAADAAISFIRPSPSKVSSSPTKLGEYLAMGLPVVTNGGVGDVAEIMAETNGGVLVSEFSAAGYAAALNALDDMLDSNDGARRERARAIYDLDSAVAEYDRAYADALAHA